ncbi:hypothetical protein EWM62_00280 [Mucilaginibacter terrigena]|uniref:Erythromycin esterase family protein n=1 Tax=Mucilaginibacter terrigena TaxID=2492395 RepID=A0A4Q5LRB5_9SPHI|nr:erythromycin esterase family protein [Mucilaginibacter terrigena]RYU91913.1 hypothetical protein EWM62_00280 [Mucilaginibacter terrigena]
MKIKVLFTAILLLNITLSFAQTDKAKIAHLAGNSATWNDGGFKNIERVFTPAVLKDQLFMIGEGHGIAYSYDVQYKLVEYLNKKMGARYLFVEMGYLDGLLLNNYLRTGNDSAYVADFQKYNGTFYYNKSEHQLLKNLYQLNKTLPESKRIVILPVDIEHGYRKAIEYLQTEVFSGNKANSPVGSALKKIDSKNGVGTDIAAEFVKLYPVFKNNAATYKRTLGQQYFDASFLLRNTYEMLNIALKNTKGTRRDSVMLENFNTYKDHYQLQNEKLIGLFGGFHVKQSDQPNDIRFAALIKRANAAKGICSALMVYSGGFMMMPKGKSDTSRTGNKYKRVINHYDYFTGSFRDGRLLDAYNSSGKAVIFKLTGKNSPFKGQKSFLMEKDQYANVDEMFQLLIQINNSPATEPLTGGMDN